MVAPLVPTLQKLQNKLSSSQMKDSQDSIKNDLLIQQGVSAIKIKTPVKKKEIKDEKVPMPDGEYTKRMQYILKFGANYGKALAKLQKYSPTALNMALENHDEKGQYDHIPNSGWTPSSITSLKNMRALSANDKLLYGMKEPVQKFSLTRTLNNEMGSMRTAHEKFSDGGDIGRKERHVNAFMKQLLKHMMVYGEQDEMNKRTDPLSKLVAMQMNDMYHRMMYLTDDKKLEELTGIDIWDKDLKQLRVYNNLYPNPLTNGGKPCMWNKRPDQDYENVLDPKKSENWEYIAHAVATSPLQTFADAKGNSRIHFRDFLRPINSFSPTTQAFVQGHRNFLEEFVTKNPQYMNETVRKQLLDNPLFWGYRNKAMPYGTSGIMGFTDMRGDASSGLHEYRPVGIDIIEAYNKKKTSGPADYGKLLKQIHEMQDNKQMASPDAPNPYRPNLNWTDPMKILSDKYGQLNTFL